MANHIIIGLGGTGGKIVQSFRKLIYQEFRTSEPETVQLGYLFVDSDKDLMKPDHNDWKVLGESVQLPAGSQVLIQGQDLEARLDDLGAFQNIAPWIGDRQLWGDVLHSIGMVRDVIGSQKRRLGRFLFACGIADFVTKLTTVVNQVQEQAGEVETHFHVLCGLAGGTGSGTVIDVVAQIRRQYPDDQNHLYPIMIYAALPERQPVPPSKTEGKNYHANAYAALVELSALSVGAYVPYDLRLQGGGLRLTGLSGEFDGCYLIFNENDKGKRVDPVDGVPRIIADFLFQKIVVSLGHPWEGLRRLERGENANRAAERQGDKLARSKLFLTFGITRIAIPEEEITEYLAGTVAIQALRQLSSNSWSPGGYIDTAPTIVAAKGYVMRPERQSAWKVTDEALMQELPFLPNDDPGNYWRPFAQEWQEWRAVTAGRLRDAADPVHSLDRIDEYFDTYFNNNYRERGVLGFFADRAGDCDDLAAHMRWTVERDLFTQWERGSLAIAEIEKIVDALRETFEPGKERLARLEDRAANLRGEREQLEAALARHRAMFARLGWIKRSFGRRTSITNQYLNDKAKLYEVRTRLAAIEFARILIAAAKNGLDLLHADVQDCMNVLSGVRQEAEAVVENRLQDKGQQQEAHDHFQRYYRKKEVTDLADALKIAEAWEKSQTADFRAKLMGMLGLPAERTFQLFRQRIRAPLLKDTLDRHSAEAARAAHNNQQLVSVQSRVLGVSIIEKLQDEFGADRSGLTRKITEWVQDAGQYLRFNPVEEGRSVPGRSEPMRSFTVFLPQDEQRTEFREHIRRAFEGAAGEAVTVVDTTSRKSEITVVKISGLFPLRMAEHTKFLRERYEERLADREERQEKIVLEIYSEDGWRNLPSLFAPEPTELAEEARPYILLGEGLGLVVEWNNPQERKPQCYARIFEGAGGQKELGATIDGVLRQLALPDAPEIIDLLKTAVVKELEQADAGKIASAEAAMRRRLDDVLAKEKGNIFSRYYLEVGEAVNVALEIVKSQQPAATVAITAGPQRT